MELTVNYSYIDQIVPPRCRTPRPQRFADGVKVLFIREVTCDQAPIAIIGGAAERTESEAVDTIAYRWFEGRLWTDGPVSYCSRRGTDIYPVLNTSLNLVHDRSVLIDTQLGIYICVHEGKKAISEHLQACAHDWLIIDGQLHRPAPEPMYVVMTFGLSCNHGGTALMTSDFLNPNIRPEAYFSLMEIQQARDYTLKVAEGRGDTEKVSTDPGYKVQVLIPAAIKWKNPAFRDSRTA
ncbi:hypothetical protein GIW05_00360 [Pseudomonas syringae]|uniref:hypothetical protein n=1 Tax=Pseudomonas syringae TaxID=317 RepID=UPI001F2FEAD6|nr:hypothetical protein [Pseudomonas syringae]MCF5381974.1 hypothetical protein [Pseudomonas syringae]MCF5419494.1 hypothetical protein [Pseudomonas syringae]MCF5454832.1 hypothetical protein [Pseudomonas syringae]MCF5456326.1 hypothetical protein [Pseudomonas syringae]